MMFIWFVEDMFCPILSCLLLGY